MSMGEAGENGNRETQRILVQMNGVSEDLLQRVIAENHFPRKFEEAAAGEETGEIELSLGLSLNGRFGVDPKKAKMLTRSSSISDFMTPLRCQDRASSTVIPIAALTRTCSLPMETEEEWRKRKELQTLRRMEAKRKRTAKQRSHKAARTRDRDRPSLPDNCEEDKVVEDRPPPPPPLPVGRNGNYLQQPYLGMPSWTRGPFIPPSKAERVNGMNGGEGVLKEHTPPPPPPPPPPPALLAPSQGSVGSLKSSSSGISEFDNQSVQGVSKSSEERSSASTVSLPDQNEQKPLISPGTPEKIGNVGRVVAENQPKKPLISDRGSNEMARKVTEDMPCVSTTGDGPDGKRVDGFLYRYKKGEEVRIVCVCHGSFLSPAEFVKHAGGSDVDHPLRHIVVYPSLL